MGFSMCVSPSSKVEQMFLSPLKCLVFVNFKGWAHQVSCSLWSNILGSVVLHSACPGGWWGQSCCASPLWEGALRWEQKWVETSKGCGNVCVMLEVGQI